MTGDPDEGALAKTWGHPRGLYGWLTVTDHKVIGLRFVVTALVFFVLGGLLAVAMRLQLSRPGGTLLGPDAYNQAFTTHGTTMMFLFAVPVMEGMGLYLVPLMVGTRNVSFPRLMAFGYFCYLFAGIMLYTALVLNTGPDMGWFSYVPLAGPDFSAGKRVDVWSQMVTLVEISTLVGAVEIIATVFRQRAPGMSLARVPLFVWAMVVTSFMAVFSMPAVMLSSTMLAADRLTHVSTHFFNPAEGGDALLWQHLFWFFAHPEVYIIFIPATGFVSTIITAFARRPDFGYTALVLSLIATAFIGFGVWVHHMFATPLPRVGKGMFTAASLMIVIPNGVQIFCWVAALWGGRLSLKLPLVFVLGFFAIFVIGGLTGVMLASVTINTQVHDTYFVVAHLHYVLFGGAVFPLFGALYYWFPKWTGRMLDARLGWANFILLFVGFNLAFFPMHHLGLRGMTRRGYTYLPEQCWGGLNLLATVGTLVLALGVLLFLVNVVWSRKRGQLAGDDPWGAGTLEWATSSPPPAYNFARPPTVRSRFPVWDGPARHVIGLSATEREVLVTTLHDAAPDHRYNMAGDSIWPFVTAAVAAATFTGLIFTPSAFPYGLVAVTAAILGWFWPAKEPDPIHNPKRPDASDEKALDVSQVPAEARDWRAPAWWGNTLFMAIETTTVGLLIASYLYLWRNYPQSQWPPPRVDHGTPILDPSPALWPGTLTLLLLLATVPLMAWVDSACRRQFDRLEELNVANPEDAPAGERPPEKPRGVLLGLVALTLLSAAALVLRWYEFPALYVRWNDNAYAALVWTLLGFHLMYVLIEAVEFAVMVLWIALYGLGENQATDVILTAAYWYWTVAIGVVIYGVVYLFPRVA